MSGSLALVALYEENVPVLPDYGSTAEVTSMMRRNRVQMMHPPRTTTGPMHQHHRTPKTLARTKMRTPAAAAGTGETIGVRGRYRPRA